VGTNEFAPIRLYRLISQREMIFSLSLLITLPCLLPAPASAQTQQFPSNPSAESGHLGASRPSSSLSDQSDLPMRPDGVRLSPKQRRAIILANFEKSKNDAAEMAALAKELREALDKQREDVLTSDLINRLEKIEKLAKKIREETKGM